MFGDASEAAYGSAVYLRCEHGSTVHCNLVASKTRVAPLTKQTMPRLELLACLVSARLSKSVRKALDDALKIHSIVYWSDSAVALAWIRSPTKEYKQFLQNRLTEIRKTAPENSWRYCLTQENPADIASRGATATEIAHNTKWWHGPPFLLKAEKEWPKQPANISS